MEKKNAGVVSYEANAILEIIGKLLELIETSYFAIFRAVRQRMVVFVDAANISVSELVRRQDCSLYTTGIGSELSAPLKPPHVKRSKTLFFTMTLLAVTAAASGCADEPEITLPPADVKAQLGETVVFICRAHAKTLLAWIINGEHFTHSNTSIEILVTTTLNESSCLLEGRLSIYALPPVNNTTIVCIAVSNPAFPSATSDPVKLTVTGTAAVSKDSLRLVLEPNEPMNVSSISVESIVTMGYQNQIKLEWNQPFTSDDPSSFEYNVKVANDKDQHHELFNATLSATSTDLPIQLMVNCCNYTIEVTAFTELYIANTTSMGVECVGYPNELQSFEVAVKMNQSSFSAMFSIKVPDPDCINLRLSNITILMDNVSANDTTEVVGPIGTKGLQGGILHYSINDLAKNSHFEATVIATNKFGSSVSGTAVHFSSHDVQNVSWSIAGHTLTIICIMANGSQAMGCVVSLTKGQEAEKKNFIVALNMTTGVVPGTFTLDESGFYLISVYDIEENGDIANSSAWSDNISIMITPDSTSSGPVLSSSPVDSPMTTVDLEDELDQSEITIGILVAIIAGVLVALLFIAFINIIICRWFLLQRRRPRNLKNYHDAADGNDYTVPDSCSSEVYKELPSAWTQGSSHVRMATDNIPNSRKSSIASTSNEDASLL